MSDGRRRLSSFAARLAVPGLGALLGWGFGGRHYLDDAIVLAIFAHLAGGGLRACAGLTAIAMIAATFPPVAWPLYAACLVPLTWLWRVEGTAPSWRGEAFGVGFAACWIVSPFVRSDFGAMGVAVHGVASAFFGLQMLGLAAVLRVTRRRPTWVAAPLVATAAVAFELARVGLLGWPLLALGFPAAETPLAQWAALVGPFGVSWLLYLVNVLWLPERLRLRDPRAWAPPMIGAGCLGLAWFGGFWLRDRVEVGPPPLTVLAVQPHRVVPERRGGRSEGESLTCLLDRLTRRELARGGPVDLVVWPEAVLAEGSPEVGGATSVGSGCREVDLAALHGRLMPDYGAPCLVGAPVRDRDGRLSNSACLVTPDGRVSRYDKQKLVIGAEALYTPGGPPTPLSLETRDGRRLRLGVAICYEMHFPWMPQFWASPKPDAFVILNNESAYRHYPGQHGHAAWAARYRAIETRTWVYVGATWAHSMVVDPQGKVLGRLDDRAGVLRVGPGGIEARLDGDDAITTRATSRR